MAEIPHIQINYCSFYILLRSIHLMKRQKIILVSIVGLKYEREDESQQNLPQYVHFIYLQLKRSLFKG